MNDDEDERLKKAFDKLREDDARRAPSFESIRKKRPRRTSWAAVVPIASALAAAAVFVVWCNRPESSPPAAVAVAAAPAAVPLGGEPSPVAAPDEAPLDFLLDLPGLRGAPDFDTSLLRGSIR